MVLFDFTPDSMSRPGSPNFDPGDPDTTSLAEIYYWPYGGWSQFVNSRQSGGSGNRAQMALLPNFFISRIQRWWRAMRAAMRGDMFLAAAFRRRQQQRRLRRASSRSRAPFR